MSVRLWDTKNFSSPLLKMLDKHTEFVQSVDWSPLIQNQVASVSWDQRALVWNFLAGGHNLISPTP